MEIKKLDPNELYLRTEIGRDEENNITVSLPSPPSMLIIEIDRDKYGVEISSIVNEVIKFYEKSKDD